MVVAGSPETVADCTASHTGRYLAPCLAETARYDLVADPGMGIAEAGVANGDLISVQGAREHNLKNVNLSLPATNWWP